MAKARKKSRKPAAKRPAKKSMRTAKIAGRKPAKTKAKPRRKATPKQGGIAGAMQTVTDAVRDMSGLRKRLSGRDSFEDQ